MFLRLICSLTLAIGLGTSAFAQSTFPDVDPATQAAQLDEALFAIQSLDAENAELRAQQDAGVFEAQQARNASLQDQANYEILLRKHAIHILWWQLVSSYMLLGVVVVIAGLGVLLSFMEVRNSMKAPEKVLAGLRGQGGAGLSEEGELPTSEAGTTLIVSAQKLQVTSAITGVVILVLSLGFLYLFVIQVLKVVPTDFSSGLAPQSEQVVPEDFGDG